MGILAFLLLLPLFGAALIAVMPADSERLIRSVALGAATVSLVLSLVLVAGFDSSIAGLQFQELHRWNPRLGTSFALADIAAAAKGLAEQTQVLLFLGFLIGFGVKTRR